MSASPAAKRPRRARTVITAPLDSTGSSASSSSSSSNSSANHIAREIILVEHLKRLVDRQRHALSRMTGCVSVIRRFAFDGHQLSACFDPRNCFWFHRPPLGGSEADAAAMAIGRGPPPLGSMHWCFEPVPEDIASVIKLDWREITTTALAAVFDAWHNDSALKQTAGIGECMRECAPRRKAVRGELDPVTLHVWNLRQLIEDHVRRHCEEATAWKLTYGDDDGYVEVPPLRITPRDIFPMTEHEAAVLHRRPHFASLLHREFVRQQQQVLEEQAQRAPATAATAASTVAPPPVAATGTVAPSNRSSSNNSSRRRSRSRSVSWYGTSARIRRRAASSCVTPEYNETSGSDAE